MESGATEKIIALTEQEAALVPPKPGTFLRTLVVRSVPCAEVEVTGDMHRVMVCPRGCGDTSKDGGLACGSVM